MIRLPTRAVSVALAAALVATTAYAQDVAQQGSAQQILRAETFVKPPSNIERMIVAPRTDISFTTPSPDRRWFMRAVGDDRGDINLYGKMHVNLGGLQIDTKANRARTITTSTRHGLVLVDPTNGNTRAIDTPKGATITAQTWSPNGSQIAYIASFDDASRVYVADVASGKASEVSKAPLLATLVTSIEWTADGKSLVVVLVPENRGAAPTHGAVEDGPQVRLTDSRALPQVIHPALLEDPHDKAMLEYYTTGQLGVVDVKTHAIRKIGTPTMIRSVDASPDGAYFLVTRMTKPFSYIVPVSSFGSVEELWDANGKVVATLATTPLRENGRGDDGVGPTATLASGGDTAKRNVRWNPNGPGLLYLQSVFANGTQTGRGQRGTGRGQQRPQPTSVRYVSWMPPFGPSDTKVLYEGTSLLANVSFSADGKTMFVADSGGVFAIRTSDPSKKFALGAGISLPGVGFGGRGGGGGRGAQNADTLAGALALRAASNGDQSVLVGSDGKSVFIQGTRTPGAKWSMEAPRPWVDRLDFETGQRTRVFESSANAFEEIVAPLDNEFSRFIYTHESPTVIADAYLRDTKTGASTQLTHAVDVGPDVSGAQYKRIQVTRPRDGIKFWVDLTLPRDWKPGTKLPGVIWFYPREYTSQAEYDRSRYATNINKFPEVPSARPASSTKIWVSQGYALIEPDCPIMGDSGKMNDNYTRDLRENLDAVIDAVVDAGYVDRDRLGIGGHSYGAFSTVNALTLVPYFKAGIAGDGMYNRSLTPFGFQSERRDFFQAEQTYLDMSPFFRADKIHGALLMYHAIEDQNVGTAPISSIRMMHALQGLGKPAALYMYHYEDHSDATYATDLDLWARWVAWFDTYVKNPQPKNPVP